MKQKNEEGHYDYMNIGELKEAIKNLPDDMEVYLRTCVNPVGNIVEAGIAEETTYGFMGSSIPCLIIGPAYQDYIVGRK